ncbi:transcriptional regulator GabR [Salinicoccus jeotgali]|uniref:Transcriptional regulator GabR n=1 Tax=Salinicoccus jeotgali TaxID=381634 RepID=A0ABP7EHU9_9STAP
MLLNIGENEKKFYKYQQIYINFKNLILNRKMLPGEKLPTKRNLSKELNVSVNSVTNAYEQLLAEGYIHAIERSGYYVEDIAQYNDDMEESEFPEDLKEEGAPRRFEISLSHMATDLEYFPHDKWLNAEKHVFKNYKEEISQISHPQGPYEIRETISRLISVNRGVKCKPEQIVIGSGTQSLIKQILTMDNTTKTVGMENPGYRRMYDLFKALNLKVNPIELDDSGININKIKESDSNILFITPSHQFPTGKIMSISRRIELLNWASESNERYIIEDDYDSEFKYGTDHIPALQSLDRHDKVIYAGTFSKTLFSGLRISYIVLPPDLLRKYREMYSNWIQGSSIFNLYTLNHFINNGDYSKYVKKMNLHYEKVREKLITTLKEEFGNSIVIHDIPAGLHFYAEFKTDKTYEEIERQATCKNIELYTLRRFSIKGIEEGQDKRALIIGFAKLRLGTVEEAVKKLKKVVFKVSKWK